MRDGPVTRREVTEAVVFNAVPLLILAAAYVAVAAALLSVLWRDRTRSHPLDWALAFVFPAIAVAALILGVLVSYEQRALGGHVWVSLCRDRRRPAPALLLLVRWADRAFAVGGARARAGGRAARLGPRPRARGGRGDLGGARPRAHARRRCPTARAPRRDAPRRRVRGRRVVSDDAHLGDGLYAELDGRDAGWWPDVRVDLRNEPSGIASAVFDAAPVTVYDVASSPLVSSAPRSPRRCRRAASGCR